MILHLFYYYFKTEVNTAFTFPLLRIYILDIVSDIVNKHNIYYYIVLVLFLLFILLSISYNNSILLFLYIYIYICICIYIYTYIYILSPLYNTHSFQLYDSLTLIIIRHQFLFVRFLNLLMTNYINCLLNVA